MLALAHDFTADKIAFLPVADHLRTADAAKGPQRGHEIDGLEDICLTLRVVAE